MGWKIGLPSLKLNNAGVKTKNCGDFGSVAKEALQERIGTDPDINPELSDMNRYTGYQTAAKLLEYSRQHTERLRDASGRKLRKDAVVMCVTILKPPAAFMATLSHDDQVRFLDDAYRAFVAIVGAENIKSRADHFDEQGAHSHVFWEPMTKDGRLCAKEVHNLQFFSRVNRELPHQLRERGWDIQDCDCYDAAKEKYQDLKQQPGRSSMRFKAEAEAQRQQLEQEVSDLREKAAKATQKQEWVDQISPQRTFTGAVKGVSLEEIEKLKEAASAAATWEAEVKGLRKQVRQLQRQIPGVQERLEARRRDLAREDHIKRLEARVSLLERFIAHPAIKPLWDKFESLLSDRRRTHSVKNKKQHNKDWER